jgi:HipA-like protein
MTSQTPASQLTPKNTAFELAYGKITVGHLALKNGVWEFRYSTEFLKQSDIRTLIDFPDQNRIYRSKNLWPFFAHRIPSLAQPQVQEVIKEEGLDVHDQALLLARFGRRAISDPFALNPV